ncbi:MAG: hypothetical protein AAGF33_04020 [Pseudomonadota bacterium]
MGVRRLTTPECADPVSLSDGIARLECGGPRQGLIVELGHGHKAMANGPMGQAGLLQRLVGHRLIAAFAADAPCSTEALPERIADVSPEARELLDLVRPLS